MRYLYRIPARDLFRNTVTCVIYSIIAVYTGSNKFVYTEHSKITSTSGYRWQQSTSEDLGDKTENGGMWADLISQSVDCVVPFDYKAVGSSFHNVNNHKPGHLPLMRSYFCFTFVWYILRTNRLKATSCARNGLMHVV